MIKDKFKRLFADDRRFKTRLLLAALVSFSCAFTFVIFGLLDLYISNASNFIFGFYDLFWTTLLAGLAVFVVLTALLVIFRGTAFNIAVSVVLGGVVAGYVQGNFLNIDFGELTGDAIMWSDYTKHAIINAAIWVAIIGACVALCLFAKKAWSKVVYIVPALLIAMQLVGLVSSYFTADSRDMFHSGNLYLSETGVYEVSDQDNVIVFILDRLDGLYIDDLQETYPGFLDPLDGFTYYDNHISMYCRTFPSVVNMLTGYTYNYDYPPVDFFDKAWGDSKILNALRDNNYTTKLYFSEKYCYSNARQLADVADNAIAGETRVDHYRTLKKMAKLSLYRYAPHFAKPRFWVSSDEFGDLVFSTRTEPRHVTNDLAFYKKLVSNRLAVQSDKNNFAFYHLQGSHPKYTYNENLEPIAKAKESRDGMLAQTRGAFKILYEYMNQLKALGLYENATIIITGDHGKSEDFNPLDRAKRTGFFLKPKGSSGTPLALSHAPTSHENFQATLAAAAGLDAKPFGTPMGDIAENADITRTFYYRVDLKTGDKSHFLEQFEVRGDASDFTNWTKVGQIDMKYIHG